MSRDVTPFLGPRSDQNFSYVFAEKAKTAVYTVPGSGFRFPLDCQHPFFTVQMFRMAGDHNINLQIRGMSGAMFKFQFSTAGRKNPTTALKSGARILLEKMETSKWINICFDLQSIVEEYWPAGDFQSIQMLEIQGSCYIRWIFGQSTPLLPHHNAADLPNHVKYTGGTSSETLLVGGRQSSSPPPSAGKRRSRIPIWTPSKPSKKMTPTQAEKRPTSHAVASPKMQVDRQEDDEEESDDPFAGKPEPEREHPDMAGIEVKRGLPQNEEEELELVYIDALKCYYCPNNQQYYQIDD